MEPAEQATVGVSNPGNYGFVFAGAILAVIAGGAMVMFLGRRKQALVPFEEDMRHVRPRLDTSSFARPIAAGPMPSQSMLRDEIEELLEMSRRQATRALGRTSRHQQEGRLLLSGFLVSDMGVIIGTRSEMLVRVIRRMNEIGNSV